MSKIRIGTVLRYSRPYSATPAVIDDLPNFFSVTHSPGKTLSLLDAGINPIGRIAQLERVPAILISSSPHKAGSETTPWQDFFHPDTGHIRYYGDNKAPGIYPEKPKGNAALLAQFDLYKSTKRADRLRASPLIFFKRIRIGNRSKGNVVFQGFGLIERVDRIVQHDIENSWSFTNYAFDFVVLSIASEAEEFDWSWIDARRNDQITNEESLKLAPTSWQTWVNEGTDAISKSRRRVSKMQVTHKSEQQPERGSHEEQVLAEIYKFYDGRKHCFEALAEYVTSRILQRAGTYRTGWITPGSSDGGADFISRLDIGTDLARVKLVVLGQAKCEKPDAPTNGNHIARTVARLRRGWIGVYITTSYFSEPVQREVIEDKYPIVLVDGLRLSREVDAAAFEQGLQSTTELLQRIDLTFNGLLAKRDPEEILLE